MTITTGKHASHQGMVEGNVQQRAVDWPADFSDGFHVILDNQELVTVRG